MELLITGITAPVALAVVAVLGYLFGRRQRVAFRRNQMARQQLDHASQVIHDLESISQQLRASLASHHSKIANFCDSVSQFAQQHEGEMKNNEVVLNDAQDILQPTMRMSSDIAHAYDEIRQRTNDLAKLKNNGMIAVD